MNGRYGKPGDTSLGKGNAPQNMNVSTASNAGAKRNPTAKKATGQTFKKAVKGK